MRRLSLVLFVCIQLRAGQSPTQSFILDAPGIGPITMSSFIHIEGKDAVLEASARNDTGLAVRRADFCVRAIKQKSGCSFTLWTTSVWKPGETVTWTYRGASGHGFPKHEVTITRISAITAYDAVQKVFVSDIDGSNGGMFAAELKAVIANSGRFELTEDRALADAVLVGRSETRDVGSRSVSQGSELGSVAHFFAVQLQAVRRSPATGRNY
jgi:hypothetical protein